MKDKSKEQARKRKLVLATQDSDFFRFSYSLLEYHGFPRASIPEEYYYLLDFRDHKEVVIFTTGDYDPNSPWEEYPRIRTLGRDRKNKETICISNYKPISLSPKKMGKTSCTRGVFHRSVSFSVKGVSKNYNSLDKKLIEAGL
ncbi:hypothetical protein A3K73_07130 [Candidatus Pacearchaeota archaeon RBG_13_36_9]|nr:MAG: hypothetical protein A3K73_07130 [Candidatus Pacearchaeota archaeon RBG_13_36_9]